MQQTTTTTRHIQSKTTIKRQANQNDAKALDVRMLNPPTITTGADALLTEQQLGFKFKLSSVWSFLDFDVSQNLSRRFHATAQVGTKVYLFGGECKIKQSHTAQTLKKILDDLLVFDVVTGEWTLLDPGNNGGPSGRKGATMVAYKDSLYVFGGAALSGCFADFWEWKVNENRWVNLTVPIIEALMKAPDNAADTQTRNDILTALKNPKQDINDIAKTVVKALPEAYPEGRAYHVCVVHDDDIIMYGGYGFTRESSALWRFHIPSSTWHNIPLQGLKQASDRQPHPGLRFGLVACVHRDNMYIFGGQQGSKLALPVLWKLSLSDYVWQQLATTGSAPAPRTYATSCVLGSRWFIHGGSSADDVFADSHEYHLDQLHWHPSSSLFSDVTLEGHTSVAITSPWGVTTVLLLGGATSGPGVPSGPVMKCDFLLPSKEELERSENIRLEDYAIRPVEAATLLWKLAREVYAKPIMGQEPAQIVDKCEQLQTVRDAAERRIAELVSRYEDIRMQHGELDERFRLQEATVNTLEASIQDEKKIQKQLREENKKLAQEMERLSKLLASRLSEEPPQGETKITEEIVYIKKEVVTQTRKLVQIQQNVSENLVGELKEIGNCLSQIDSEVVPKKASGDLKSISDDISRIVTKIEKVQKTAENIFTELSEMTMQLATSTNELQSVQAPSDKKPKTKPKKDRVASEDPTEAVSSRKTTHSDKNLASGLKKSTSTKSKSPEKSEVESLAPPVPGINRGIAAGGKSGLLDLGALKTRKQSGTKASAIDAATSVKPPYVKGIDVGLQCGTGVLRLKPASSGSSPTKSKQVSAS